MKIFDQPENFPPSLFHVWEFLHVYGASTEDVIVDSVAYPESDSATSEPETPASPPQRERMPEKTVRSIIKVGLYLSVFVKSEDSISLDQDFSHDFSHEDFWHQVRTFLFLHGMNGDKDTRAESLPVAIAWFLSLPLSKSPGSWDQAQRILASDFGSPISTKANRAWIVSNDTQWANFTRWITALGFARLLPTSKGTSPVVVPDVSRAMTPFVLKVVSDQWTPVSHVLNQLSKEIPVFHEGKAWTFLPSDAKERSSLASDVVYTGFKVMEQQGLIELEKVTDSPDLVTFGSSAYPLDRIRKVQRL